MRTFRTQHRHGAIYVRKEMMKLSTCNMHRTWTLYRARQSHFKIIIIITLCKEYIVFCKQWERAYLQVKYQLKIASPLRTSPVIINLPADSSIIFRNKITSDRITFSLLDWVPKHITHCTENHLSYVKPATYQSFKNTQKGLIKSCLFRSPVRVPVKPGCCRDRMPHRKLFTWVQSSLVLRPRGVPWILTFLLELFELQINPATALSLFCRIVKFDNKNHQRLCFYYYGQLIRPV